MLLLFLTILQDSVFLLHMNTYWNFPGCGVEMVSAVLCLNVEPWRESRDVHREYEKKQLKVLSKLEYMHKVTVLVVS